MCEYCGAGGECCVCGRGLTPENAGARYGPTPPAAGPGGAGERIRRVRGWLAEFRAAVAELEQELADLLKADGRRPGDGTDQPALFDPSAQPKLF